MHCGGIVIFRNNVPDNLFLRDFEIKQGETGKQIWMNKDQVEDADMIKIDLLSNQGISQLLDISKRPIDDYPYDDIKVMKLLRTGDNLGLTQAESRGMKDFNDNETKKYWRFSYCSSIDQTCCI